MKDYDHFRGYLHSKHLRWSYGTIAESDAERWQRDVARKPVLDMVRAVTAAGYDGIYVDRYGYPDGGAALQAELRATLHTEPVVSPNNRLFFFRLIGHF